MSDPFTFDEDRIRIERAGAWKGEDHGYNVLSYTLPTGNLLQMGDNKGSKRGNDFAYLKKFHPAVYKWRVGQLKESFDDFVTTLTAHQRLAWVAAHQKEKTDVQTSS